VQSGVKGVRVTCTHERQIIKVQGGNVQVRRSRLHARSCVMRNARVAAHEIGRSFHVAQRRKLPSVFRRRVRLHACGAAVEREWSCVEKTPLSLPTVLSRRKHHRRPTKARRRVDRRVMLSQHTNREAPCAVCSMLFEWYAARCIAARHERMLQRGGNEESPCVSKWCTRNRMF